MNLGFGSSAFVIPSHFEEESEFWGTYLYAIFFASRILTDVGGEQPHPETELERSFMLIVSMGGLFVGAAIVASIVDLVRNFRGKGES